MTDLDEKGLYEDMTPEQEDQLEERCILCLEKPALQSHSRYVYETPWDDYETEKFFCSEKCADIYLYEGDFSYFWCEQCEREICEQHPMNGWHIQYRIYNDEQICLRCYQALILENGVEREKLEKGQIPGMFFSNGNIEAKEAGYKEVSGFIHFFVNNQDKADMFIKKALELMNDGLKIVIGYEKLAIGGIEGYVTLMAKDGDQDGF
jgi:hypothetical protein